MLIYNEGLVKQQKNIQKLPKRNKTMSNKDSQKDENVNKPKIK